MIGFVVILFLVVLLIYSLYQKTTPVLMRFQIILIILIILAIVIPYWHYMRRVVDGFTNLGYNEPDNNSDPKAKDKIYNQAGTYAYDPHFVRGDRPLPVAAEGAMRKDTVCMVVTGNNPENRLAALAETITVPETICMATPATAVAATPVATTQSVQAAIQPTVASLPVVVPPNGGAGTRTVGWQTAMGDTDDTNL